ncbi:type II toxin-antitoxin system VapC family toxin [Nitratifractor sp.]
MSFLLDSNILIYYLGGVPEAVTFVRREIDRCHISLISYYEVLNYPFENDEAEKKVREFLGLFPQLKIDHTIVEKALENRKRSRIKMADNLIAATAQVHGYTVVTRNVRDFDGIVETFDPMME